MGVGFREAPFKNNLKNIQKFEMALNSPPPTHLQNIFKLYKKLGALKAKTKGVFNRLIAAMVTYVFYHEDDHNFFHNDWAFV